MKLLLFLVIASVSFGQSDSTDIEQDTVSWAIIAETIIPNNMVVSEPSNLVCPICASKDWKSKVLITFSHYVSFRQDRQFGDWNFDVHSCEYGHSFRVGTWEDMGKTEVIDTLTDKHPK